MLSKTFNFFVFSLFATTTIARADIMWPQQNQEEPSNVAVEVCKSLPYGKTECLVTFQNDYFDPKIQRVCMRAVNYDRANCLEAAKNKDFSQAAADACASEPNYNVSSCLKQFRGTPHYADEARAEIIVDAIEQALRDLIRGYQTSADGASCDVLNSNNNSLGKVATTDFLRVARQFARNQNSCVVTSVKGVERTRVLISGSGTLLGTRLTEKETSSLKSSHGYRRCRVLQCSVSGYVQNTPNYLSGVTSNAEHD